MSEIKIFGQPHQSRLQFEIKICSDFGMCSLNSTYNVSSFLSFHRRRRDDRHPDGVLPHVVQDPGVADRVGDHRVDAHDEVEQQELFREVRR